MFVAYSEGEEDELILLSEQNNDTDLVYLIFIQYYYMFRLSASVIIRKEYSFRKRRGSFCEPVCLYTL